MTLPVTLRLPRRAFLKVSAAGGGGLLVTCVLGLGRESGSVPLESAESEGFAPDAYLRVSSDGETTILIDRTEMGQGVITALAMIVAEELETDWSKVRTEFAPTTETYESLRGGSLGTGGSTSIRTSWELLRKAGATARELLIAAAARTWEVEPSTCRARQGAVVHEPSGRVLPYGALASRAATLPVPENPPLKDPSHFMLIGRDRPRLDTPGKVHGSTVFGIDVKRPGLLTAVVARCPVMGGTVARLDDSRAKAVRGVTHVLTIDGGVAVVGEGYWPASKGREALDITWDEGPRAATSSADLWRQAEELGARPGRVARQDGDVTAVFAGDTRVIEAVYEAPLVAHAPMEPPSATAHVQADRCELWVSTQVQSAARDTAAEITGLPKEQVHLHLQHLGGGFGRKLETDYVADAVQISKATGAPIKVIWSREDDMRHSYYRPMAWNRLRAALGPDGRPIAYHHRIVGESILLTMDRSLLEDSAWVDRSSVEVAADLPYAVPNILVDWTHLDTGVQMGWWRSVGASQNGFVVECFIDELATAAGADPFEYRRSLLAGNDRHLRVLERAADAAGWGRPRPEGCGRGIAVVESFRSVAAQVAEVTVRADGTVTVDRVVCAIDCGIAVNPAGVVQQVESGIVFGLSSLYQEITLARGRVEQSNFHDFPLLRLADSPPIETHIIPGSGAPTGVGEPGVPPLAPAVVNAIAAASGRRLRRLPIRKGDVGAATSGR